MKLYWILILLPLFGAAQKQSAYPIKILALGDSYTIGQSVKENERWPVQLIDALREKGLTCASPVILAATGWRTDDLENAIERSNLPHDYDLVSLLIGVNDYYQGKSVEAYAVEFEKLLNKAIELARGNKANVFVVSIPDYGFTPFGKLDQSIISKGIDSFNAVNKKLTEKAGVCYVNITDISRRGIAESSLVARDGLHPSGKMYREWTDRMMLAIPKLAEKN